MSSQRVIKGLIGSYKEVRAVIFINLLGNGPVMLLKLKSLKNEEHGIKDNKSDYGPWYLVNVQELTVYLKVDIYQYPMEEYLILRHFSEF